ncbi:MAG: hypothetical protein ACI85I_001010 [Arenicella sp.]|jgi:hypothetical protein
MYQLFTTMKQFIFPIFLGSLITSCASSYTNLNPRNTFYISSEKPEEITLSYKYGVLKESGNKKYSKKEDKSGLQVVAVKVTNNSDRAVTLNENYSIYAGGSQVNLMSPSYVAKEIKQGVAIYLLYMLLTPMVYTESDDFGRTTSTTPVGLIIGPGITLLNIGRAASANAKFRKDLENFSLIGKSIAPGETAYGLMGVQNTGYAPLKAKLTD